MTYKEQFEYCQRIGRHTRPREFLLWFIGMFFPIAVGLSAFIAWHNSLVGVPTVFHIVMRAIIAFIAFGGGMIVFYFKVIRPAMQAAKEAAVKDGDET